MRGQSPRTKLPSSHLDEACRDWRMARLRIGSPLPKLNSIDYGYPSERSHMRRKKKVDLDGDVVRGDPASNVLGREEEQSARVHAEQAPKPPKTLKIHLTEIRHRMSEIKPLVEEVPRLEAAHEALKKIK